MKSFPRIKKRGAIELSMTTIIIVVIGITILTLGLRWVYNIFGGLESQRQKLIEATEEEIRKTFGDSDDPINLLTSAISIEQDKFYDLSVGLKNTYGEPRNFKYDIEIIDAPQNVQPSQILSWFRWDKSEIRLNSGELYTDSVSIDPKDAPLGVYKFKLTLNCIDCPGSPADNAHSAPLTMRVVTK